MLKYKIEGYKSEEDEKYTIPTFSAAIKPNVKAPKTSFKSRQVQNSGEIRTLAVPNNFSGGLEELEERVKSMMEKSQNKYANGLRLAHVCQVCGKEGMGSAIKEHIEANHLEGIVIPCNLCDKTFRSRNGFRQHNRHHNQLI